MISKKEQIIRDRFVFSNHVTHDGTPRSIAHHVPSPDNPKDYYITKMADGKKIKATTYDKLINKLYEFYTNSLRDTTIESVFNAAISEKAITENPNPHTITHYKYDYKRLISKDLASEDIRKITSTVLKQYTQEWVNNIHPTRKVFFQYKSVLNVIFNYAYAHKIIDNNPVATLKNKAYLKSCDTSISRPDEKILSPDEIKSLQNAVRHRMTLKKYGKYYINGFAMLFAIETGVRVGELCALKWEDVWESSIHIHAQQLTEIKDGKKVYYYSHSTKNEKGISQDGREFPLTRKIKALLKEIHDLQEELNIKSEFIFCHEDGEWIKTDAYITFLRRLCQSFEFKVTNNHALRMSLNSNVLLPMGVSVADRAAMLGHSIETNLKFYSFAQKGYLENVRILLDSEDVPFEGTLREPQNVIIFPQKESPRMLKYQRFQALNTHAEDGI
ncbi:MAG: tyrosine-type recombinase/integrase [Lachnospiraceae bacterium]|nr:tyrosine-type recombinase/integrase [Lachnospiraceae bacterium]